MLDEYDLSGGVRAKHVTRRASKKSFYADKRRDLRLVQGDALELLRATESESFDLIFADPPYFLSNNGVTCQSGRRASVNKGAWDKAPAVGEIQDFNVAWLGECRRLLKPDGTIWVTGTSHNIYSVGFALQTLGYKILNDIAWYKVNPPPNLACRYFTHATETILWAKRDAKAKHTFNYQEMKQANGGKQMQSLWQITSPPAREKRYGKHPTQKPELLLERIIRASSNEGDHVLDPFCGSGTTGVVAARLKRRFTGFDVDENYLRIASQRIKDELAVLENSPRGV
ncbi:MAG TPA: DNA methyltransferase [Pyrinomonadaceae bacterium]|nr:DNA methyltransferase [Pyrinomonadaceae bacterium]